MVLRCGDSLTIALFAFEAPYSEPAELRPPGRRRGTQTIGVNCTFTGRIGDFRRRTRQLTSQAFGGFRGPLPTILGGPERLPAVSRRTK